MYRQKTSVESYQLVGHFAEPVIRQGLRNSAKLAALSKSPKVVLDSKQLLTKSPHRVRDSGPHNEAGVVDGQTCRDDKLTIEISNR